MISNRKYINLLEEGNERLERKVDLLKDLKEFYRRKNIELQADIEVKENDVCNLIEINKELSLSNNYLENKIKLLEQVIKQHEENECRLNQKVIKYKGMLDKIDNCTRILEERGINEWEYGKLAEEPKEEVTYKEMMNEFTRFCKVYGISCRGCKFSEGLKEDCRTLYILDNYNVTRKDNK